MADSSPSVGWPWCFWRLGILTTILNGPHSTQRLLHSNALLSYCPVGAFSGNNLTLMPELKSQGRPRKWSSGFSDAGTLSGKFSKNSVHKVFGVERKKVGQTSPQLSPWLSNTCPSRFKLHSGNNSSNNKLLSFIQIKMHSPSSLLPDWNNFLSPTNDFRIK